MSITEAKGAQKDRTIISIVIPAITHEFHVAKDIGRLGTAFSLTNYAFLSVFRKIYTFLDIKTTFVTSVAFFGTDSALRSAGSNSIALIIVEPLCVLVL